MRLSSLCKAHNLFPLILLCARVRNFLKAEDDEVFEAISEYTDSRDVVAARSRFFHRHVRILLYTERAHFYHRHRLRGIKVSAHG